MLTYYWSRTPGRFLNKLTGEQPVWNVANGPRFTGTVREWYETFIETLYDVASKIEERGPLDIYVSERVLTILECSVLYKPALNTPNFKDFPEGTLVEVHQGGFRSMGNRTTRVLLREKGDASIVELSVNNDVKAQIIVKNLDIM